MVSDTAISDTAIQAEFVIADLLETGRLGFEAAHFFIAGTRAWIHLRFHSA